SGTDGLTAKNAYIQRVGLMLNASGAPNPEKCCKALLASKLRQTARDCKTAIPGVANQTGAERSPGTASLAGSRGVL
ncbi:MAG: hypothetical protein WEA31_03960, partial [Pirellulales bacterium]